MRYNETPVSFMITPLSDPKRKPYSPISIKSLSPFKTLSAPHASEAIQDEWTPDFLIEIYNSANLSQSPILPK